MARFETVVLDEQVERDIDNLIAQGLAESGADVPPPLRAEAVARIREVLFAQGVEGAVPPRAIVSEYIEARNKADKVALAAEQPAKKTKEK